MTVTGWYILKFCVLFVCPVCPYDSMILLVDILIKSYESALDCPSTLTEKNILTSKRALCHSGRSTLNRK